MARLLEDREVSRARVPPSVLLGFTFYGGGNIGDDLALAGLLESLSSIPGGTDASLEASTHGDARSQRTRFPQIRWTDADTSNRFLPARHACWAGAGGTPFQWTCGDWMLAPWTRELPLIEDHAVRVLIGVGAESEITPRRREFARIAERYQRISTRDAHSAGVIESLGVPASKLFVGADLANISLAKMSFESGQQEYETGIVVAGDTLSVNDIDAIGRFVGLQPRKVAFIAGEVSPGANFERGIHRGLARFPWSAFSRRAVLEVPDYPRCSLAELVSPIAKCQTVVSSRYHCLLAAAWAGCRVAAIGRSSKVTALARVLGVPYCEPPLSAKSLQEIRDGATVVPRSLLEELARRAVAGVRFAFADAE
jgi:hypothetical protein